MNEIVSSELIEKFSKATNRLILLDYDGTLVDHTPKAETARLSEQLFDILMRLANMISNRVYIITGRAHPEIDKFLAQLPIGIIAEHGAMVKESNQWIDQVIDDGLWRKAIIPILNEFTIKCPESFIEEKAFSLSWHYRNSERNSGNMQSRQLITRIEKIKQYFNLKILDGNKVVEIMSSKIGKGNAVKKLFEKQDYDFILSIGDDKADEEMFEFLLNIKGAITIKVGTGSSLAGYYLNSISEVVSLLKQLSG